MKIQSVNPIYKTIYLAGGCFWGVEAYFSRVPGVVETTVGYANGSIENPTYEDVCTGTTGFTETVKVLFDATIISVEELVLHFFRIIDPYSLNKQGNDVGTQYRSGIYYDDYSLVEPIKKVMNYLDKEKKFVVELLALKNFYEGEEYHQDYLEKNPRGYCHIDVSGATKSLIDESGHVESEDILKSRIGDIAYAVTMESATEAPFTGEYDKHFEKGIYVDIVSGKPLFLSADKYNSGCGWPAFTRPITADVIEYARDTSLGRERVEVRSDTSHLGHVFTDGPANQGGLRYCINSAAIRFVPVEKMEEEGYGYLIPLVR